MLVNGAQYRDHSSKAMVSGFNRAPSVHLKSMHTLFFCGNIGTMSPPVRKQVGQIENLYKCCTSW